jgi:sugar phosphate isomerase/epimerase
MSDISTRRQFLQTTAATAAAMTIPWSTASAMPAADVATDASLPTIGIATLGFGTWTNSRLADELDRQDMRTIQLFLNQVDSRYWQYNGRSDVSDLTDERCREIADTYRDKGIAIHSLGVYTNLIHPDPAERAANLDYFAAMMRVAAAMQVKYLITEAGHYHPEGPPPRVPHHFQEEVWNKMVATGKQLAQLADAHNVTVLFEPFFRGFLASAKRTRVFLEEVDSPHIRALLDPANLLEVDDVQEMFDQLQPWIDCLHAKDRKLHVDRGVPAGQGDLDYRRFVTLAAECTPHAPLILEYVGPDDYLQARAHLQQALANR